MKFLLSFALIFLTPAVGSAASWRTFTDIKGRKIEAKVIRVESDFVVVELKTNGKQLPIDLENLSEEDVEYLNHYDDSPAEGETAESTNPDDEALPDGEPKAGRLYPRTREEIRAGIREIQKQEKPEEELKQEKPSAENCKL